MRTSCYQVYTNTLGGAVSPTGLHLGLLVMRTCDPSTAGTYGCFSAESTGIDSRWEGRHGV